MTTVIQHFTHDGKWEESLGMAKEMLWSAQKGMWGWDWGLGSTFGNGM